MQYAVSTAIERRLNYAAVLLPLLCFVLLTYRDILTGLVRQWAADDNYSHGFIVVPLAVYFGWQRQAELRATPVRPSSLGVVVVMASLGLFVAGVASAELFLARVSLVGLLAGIGLFLLGPVHIRLLAFPLLFLLLMIPLPALVFNEIAFPLQLLASGAGEVALRAAGVPVLRDGNILELAAVRLEVADACSGIRSLMSLLTCAVVLGRVTGCSTARMWLLALSTVPIAVVTNAARVSGTGLAAHRWGTAAAEGVLHTASGGVVFVAAMLALVALERITRPRVAQVEP